MLVVLTLISPTNVWALEAYFDCDGEDAGTYQVSPSCNIGSLPTMCAGRLPVQYWSSSECGDAETDTEICDKYNYEGCQATEWLAHTTTSCTNCVECNAGYYLPANSSTCKQCEAGYYCSATLTYQPSTNQTQGRSSCSKGKYSNAGAIKCNDCPAGFRDGTAAAGINNCRATINAGFYLTSNNTEASCPMGTYRASSTSVYYGSTDSCDLCPQGTYSSSSVTEEMGRTTCYACTEGTTTPVPTTTNGNRTCSEPCPNRTGVATWNHPSFNSTTPYNVCSINTCSTGYTRTGSASATSSYTCEANKFTVVYNGGGGSGTNPTPQTCTFNQPCYASSTNPYTRDGYDFDGWKCTINGTTCTTYNNIVGLGGTIKNATTTNNATITLTATWKAKSKTIYIYLYSNTPQGPRTQISTGVQYTANDNSLSMVAKATDTATIKNAISNNVTNKYSYNWANGTTFDIYSVPSISNTTKLGTVKLNIGSSGSSITFLDATTRDKVISSTSSSIFIHLPLTANPYNVYMIPNASTSISPKVSINTTPIATKYFGEPPATGVTPDKTKVTTCEFVSYSNNITSTTYGYIPSDAQPTYYECSGTTSPATIYTATNSDTMFEPSTNGRNICIGYSMETCPTGSRCNSCTATKCSAGEYQDKMGQNTCNSCAALPRQGTYVYSDIGSDSKNDCYLTIGPGSYVPTAGDSGGSGYKQCPAGDYCDYAANTKVYYNETKPTSGKCKSGYYCPTGSSSKTEKSCATETGNKYTQSAEQSDNISDCYLTLTQGNCVAKQGAGQTECPAGSFCNHTGGTKIYFNSPNTPITGGITGTCQAGYYCPKGSSSETEKSCSTETGGKYPYSYARAGSKNECYLELTEGQYVPNAGAGPAACPTGNKCVFDNKDDSKDELVYFNETFAATPCEAGTYQNETGKTTCKPCNNGTYQDETGKTSCKDCTGNKYTLGPDSGSSNYDATKGYAACTECNNTKGIIDFPEECKNGCVIKDNQHNACKACGLNSYMSGTQCVKCPKGTYQEEGGVANGNTFCLSCQDGETHTTEATEGFYTSDTYDNVDGFDEACYIDITKVSLTDKKGSKKLEDIVPAKTKLHVEQKTSIPK